MNQIEQIYLDQGRGSLGSLEELFLCLKNIGVGEERITQIANLVNSIIEDYGKLFKEGGIVVYTNGAQINTEAAHKLMNLIKQKSVFMHKFNKVGFIGLTVNEFMEEINKADLTEEQKNELIENLRSCKIIPEGKHYLLTIIYPDFLKRLRIGPNNCGDINKGYPYILVPKEKTVIKNHCIDDVEQGLVGVQSELGTILRMLKNVLENKLSELGISIVKSNQSVENKNSKPSASDMIVRLIVAEIIKKNIVEQ